MRLNPAAALGAALPIVPLAACSALSSGGGSPYGSGDPALAASNLGGGPVDPFLTNGQAVQRAVDAIAGQAPRFTQPVNVG